MRRKKINPVNLVNPVYSLRRSKTMSKTILHTYFSTIALLLSTFSFLTSTQPAQTSAQNKKLTPEELIARHLDSIGTAEARSKASSRVAGGETKFISRFGGSATVDGQVMMVSRSEERRVGKEW